MYISVAVIAYNEEATLNRILDNIKLQDYDHSKMEVVLVDSASTDSTKDIMLEFASTQKDFKNIQVLDNPKKTLPCGWNVLLDNFQGEAVIRVDAHAEIPADFVSKNVIRLQEGEMIVGGVRPNIIDEETPWKNTLLLAEDSMFGSSIAPYRKGNNANQAEPVYMKSLFHAAYRREVFEKIGHYNEDLSRTEDNEIHYRMREAGYKLRFDPDIISYQHTRNSLPKMLKQKYANGFWIGKTSLICPKCLSIFHFVPFAFVSAIIATTFGKGFCKLLRLKNTFLGKFVNGSSKLMWRMYWGLAAVMSVLAVVNNKDKRNKTNVLLPIIFFLLHISYGIGTLWGLVTSFIKKDDK